MKDGTLPVMAAVVSAIDTALTGGDFNGAYVGPNPAESDSLPYVVISDTTGVAFPTKTTEGMDMTITLVCWSSTLTTTTGALALRDDVIQALTSRTSPITVTGYTVEHAETDFVGGTIREENPPDTYWGAPVRIRFRMIES